MTDRERDREDGNEEPEEGSEDREGEAGSPRARGARGDEADGGGAGGEDEAGDALPAADPAGIERIQPNKNRVVQVARTGGRKLFDEAGKQDFLEWFAATCNASWSAELAGFNYKTVCRHRLTDERFAEAWDRAVRQGYARLDAKRIETKRKALPIGIEGDRDAPDMDDMDPERMDAILREHKREIAGIRKQGRRPRVATNAEVREALVKRLKIFGERARRRAAGGGGAMGEEKGMSRRDAAARRGDDVGPLNRPSDGPPPRSGEDKP